MKILCVGQNYRKHVEELGFPASEDPIWFWKPDTCVVPAGTPVRLPTDIGRIEHEVELALRIGPDGLPDAFTVAIDITARDMQRLAKQNGKPWARSKGYDDFLPMGDWVAAEGVDFQDLRLQLSINDELRQDESTAAMTWPVLELVKRAGEWTTLLPGDVLVTGTPHGTSPLAPGDTVAASVVGHVDASWTMVAR